MIAILLGAVLVFFMFPKHDEEKRLLAEYHARTRHGRARRERLLDRGNARVSNRQEALRHETT